MSKLDTLPVNTPRSEPRVPSPFSVGSEDEDDILLYPPLSKDVQPEDVDSLIAKEMSSLSIKDREKVYFDVHGVSDETKETPELITNSLREMRIELDNLPNVEAYQTAISMDPGYVQNEKFLLKFLRTESFDVPKAARRVVRHFQSKLELFGKDKLVKDILQDDLDEESLAFLYDGSAQVLELRDRAGRLVIVSLFHPSGVSVISKLRRTFYGMMVEAEDEETQRKGCVGISVLAGRSVSLSETPHRLEWSSRLASLLRALPIRYEAMHLCHDSITWRPFQAIFKVAASMFTRVRIREHYGNQAYCLFRLQTFGIPTDFFPLDEDGRILTEGNISRWGKRRNLERIRLHGQKTEQSEKAGKGGATEKLEKQEEEDQEQKEERGGDTASPKRITELKTPNSAEEGGKSPGDLFRVGTPGHSDVLLGRGKAYYQHVGNIRLRNWIEEKSPMYEKANFTEKQRIGSEVVSLIKKSGGRFLKEDHAGWVEVEHVIARKKVAHAFRTLRALRHQSSGGGATKEPRPEISGDGGMVNASKRARFLP